MSDFGGIQGNLTDRSLKQLIQTAISHYDRATWDGVNRSGFVAVGDYVMVMMDVVPDKVGSIIVPDSAREHKSAAAETGIIVSLGPDAFRYNLPMTGPWEGPRPAPGNRVYFERYAGQIMHGTDEREYRMMRYKNIFSVENTAPDTLEDENV